MAHKTCIIRTKIYDTNCIFMWKRPKPKLLSLTTIMIQTQYHQFYYCLTVLPRKEKTGFSNRQAVSVSFEVVKQVSLKMTWAFLHNMTTKHNSPSL